MGIVGGLFKGAGLLTKGSLWGVGKLARGVTAGGLIGTGGLLSIIPGGALIGGPLMAGGAAVAFVGPGKMISGATNVAKSALGVVKQNAQDKFDAKVQQTKQRTMDYLDKKTGGLARQFNEVGKAMKNPKFVTTHGKNIGEEFGKAISRKLGLTEAEATIVESQIVTNPELAKMADDGELSNEEAEALQTFISDRTIVTDFEDAVTNKEPVTLAQDEKAKPEPSTFQFVQTI